MSFPTILYRCPGAFHRPGGTYSYKTAADAEQLASLRASGWFLTLPEAISGDADDNSAPTREELEQEAREMGLKFDGRTTDAKLGRMIAEALEA